MPTSLQALALPPDASARAREELRKPIGYFTNDRHRTDYPTYRRKGWDIGGGPTEAGCKIIGERLKGSGMRWVEEGAAAVGALRALAGDVDTTIRTKHEWRAMYEARAS